MPDAISVSILADFAAAKLRREFKIMTGEERHRHRIINVEQEGWPIDPKTIPLLKGLPSDQQQALLAGINFFRLERGEFAFQTGDAADQLYILLEGRMKIYENTPEGREQILYIYNPGDFVGGLNVLKDHSYLYMGQMLEDSLLATMNKEVFDCYALNNPLILKRILEKSYDRIRWAEDLISRMGSSNAEMKVAALLSRLVTDFGVEKEDGIHLELSINREEMGSYAGVARETMIRKLVEFKDKGLIELPDHKSIIIKDLKGLRDLLFG
ncbi:MAG: Crp/Fnr family transcriptional regulator [Eubacteriales bacterium]|nr:Crp/Fnr family transcriptional regulator [Eubacteriales bacterium]